MPKLKSVISNSMGLSSFLNELKITFETEINYSPIEIPLTFAGITDADIQSIIHFLTDKRDRLFIFKINQNQLLNDRLALIGRRSVLNQTALKILQTTSAEAKIDALKETLNSPSPVIHAGIQIQKSLQLPEVVEINAATTEVVGAAVVEMPTQLELCDVRMLDSHVLSNQLHCSGITKIDQVALDLINQHAHVFSQGFVLNNLPRGFYIDSVQHALCYSENSAKFPSPLAPMLNVPEVMVSPDSAKMRIIFPNEVSVSNDTIRNLHIPSLPLQREALLSLVSPEHKNDFEHFLTSLENTNQTRLVQPWLVDQFVLGGENHARLLMRLFKNCINRKVNIEFLLDPHVQQALLSTRGIKNLQKLIKLPGEQIAWWNALTREHRADPAAQFDFNTYFEAYTQSFLPRVAKLNLSLPTDATGACPIQNQRGHFLLTLNRVIDVLEMAENPHAQCLALGQLNWGPTGVHYAMVAAPAEHRFKHVDACMNIQQASDTVVSLELMEGMLTPGESPELKTLMYRYIGQHWKKDIQLTDIKEQFALIDNLTGWTMLQRKQLGFILTSTFASPNVLSAVKMKAAMTRCLAGLQPLTSESDRSYLLTALTRCFRFKPCPSIYEVQGIIELCIELKNVFPEKNFKHELVEPLLHCYENEGMAFLTCLNERIQKTIPPTGTPTNKKDQLSALINMMSFLQRNRSVQPLTMPIKMMLAKLNEPDLAENHLTDLLAAIQSLQNSSPEDTSCIDVVLALLNEINTAKSQTLPNLTDIIGFIDTFKVSATTLLEPTQSLMQQVDVLKNWISEHHLLPGCIFGNGDISKLDDLIIEALVDAITKRSSLLQIDRVKRQAFEALDSKFVPTELQLKLQRNLGPLFDALNDLVNLLQTPNPQFDHLMTLLGTVENTLPILMDDTYSVPIVGSTRGDFLISLLVTGELKPNDDMTGMLFRKALRSAYGLIVDKITTHFADPEHQREAKDLDAPMVLKWLRQLSDNHSLTFLFSDELVDKKVLPALKRVLHLLNIQDATHAFERSIIEAASQFDLTKKAHIALTEYKLKIEGIASYLNALIDIKQKNEPAVFDLIMTQLQTGPLATLEHVHRGNLIHILMKYCADERTLKLYLQQFASILENSVEAPNSISISRAIVGLDSVFKIESLDPETRQLFFRMSIVHNLRSTSVFPLETLNRFKNFRTDNAKQEVTKSEISTQLIQIIGQMTDQDSPDLIGSLVEATEVFLTAHQESGLLCLGLLKRISPQAFSHDFSCYISVLNQLSLLPPEKQAACITILTGLANNKKDETVTSTLLKEIINGLSRRSVADLEQLSHLFQIPPYPVAQSLKTALLQDSERFQIFCSNLDLNPFAEIGEERPLSIHFSSDRVSYAINSLKDLMDEVSFPTALQLQLARQLTYIETLGYTDPLNPTDFNGVKKLTAVSRHDLKHYAQGLLSQLRHQKLTDPQKLERTQLELLAALREIYFRTTGLFPNTTQMLMLLISLQDPSTNLLMRIKTGEGKSIITPMLAVLQWIQGGTVDVCTANRTLLGRDYEDSCEPFFTFLGIRSAMIQSHTSPDTYQVDGINCSTLEDMSLFRLSAKETKQEHLLGQKGRIHLVLDECDDALLDQTTLYKLVVDKSESVNDPSYSEDWIYEAAYDFVYHTNYLNTDPSNGAAVWDEDEDLDQFRLFLNNRVNSHAVRQKIIMQTSNTKLREWIHATCKAKMLVENKHFIVQPIRGKNDAGNEVIQSMRCVPLVRSTPKPGCIFTDGVQQALQTRFRKDPNSLPQANNFNIDNDPPVLASQSASGLVQFYQGTHGRLVGISGTPGDQTELKYLNTLLGTRAIEVAPFAGDHRKIHAPKFTYSHEESLLAIQDVIDSIKRPITQPMMAVNTDVVTSDSFNVQAAFFKRAREAVQNWRPTQTQPILVICEDFDDVKKIHQSFKHYEDAGYNVQIVTGTQTKDELDSIIKQAGEVNTITIGTAMLARGIDIKPKDHPDGLFVIQTYTDSQRATTQIEGRAARNGKPGQWLPIYEVKRPLNWFTRFLYYLFPSMRQRANERAVIESQTNIKRQANIERIYTQAIAQAQDTLMEQIYAWESLLLELEPDNAILRQDLYHWRESLLVEIAHCHNSSLTTDNYRLGIEEFKSNIARLWETAREEKWAAEAKKATNLSPEQHIQLDYLGARDLLLELNIQAPVQRQAEALRAGTDALMNQKLESVIMNKAGAVLNYTPQIDPQAAQALELAQSRQLLPQVIVALSDLDAHTRRFYLQGKEAGLPKNAVREQVKQYIFDSYQRDLNTASLDRVQRELIKLKELILDFEPRIKSRSLPDQFKMQGILRMIFDLYRKSELDIGDQLASLKQRYDDAIMKTLAIHIMTEFAWATHTSSLSIHRLFESASAKRAARHLYELADQVRQNPDDEERIHQLYEGLLEERLNIKNTMSLSISHRAPARVIQQTLNTIDSLTIAPHCEASYRDETYDKVLSAHHVEQFRSKLLKISAKVKNAEAPLWRHLLVNLEGKINAAQDDQVSVILELHSAVNRFQQYEAYKPYQKDLEQLNQHLTKSLQALQKPNGLKQDLQENLIKKHRSRFARLLHLPAEQVTLRSGTDGIQSYVELQLENAQGPEEKFSHYVPTPTIQAKITQNRVSLIALGQYLTTHEAALIALNSSEVIADLPQVQQQRFMKLFQLKALNDEDWNNGLRNAEHLLNVLPAPLQSVVKQLRALRNLDELDGDIGQNIIRQRELRNQLQTDVTRLNGLSVDMARLKDKLCEQKKLSENGNIFARAANWLKNYHSDDQRALTELEDTFNSLRQSNASAEAELRELISTLDLRRDRLVAEGKRLLAQHIISAPKMLVDEMKASIQRAEKSLIDIQKIETKKASYQKLQFFTPAALLAYEASLEHEEQSIPQVN